MVCIDLLYGVYGLVVWCVLTCCMMCIDLLYRVYRLVVWCVSTCMVCIDLLHGVSTCCMGVY